MLKIFSKNLSNIIISEKVEKLLTESGYRFEVSEDINMLSIINKNGKTVYELWVKEDVSNESVTVLEKERITYCNHIEILTRRDGNGSWVPYLDKY